VTLAWEPAVLKQLADEADGDRVLIAIDPASLVAAFDDVEAHGLREVGATLAIAVTALGGAGGAAAAVDSSSGQSSAQPPAVEATVDTSWQAAAAESGYGVRGTPSDVAGAGDDGGSISAPSAGVTAALAGGAALTIAAAAFALRRGREPKLA
jgi:hypothetical protein